MGSGNKLPQAYKNLREHLYNIEHKIEIKSIKKIQFVQYGKSLDARVKIMSCPYQRNNSTIINKGKRESSISVLKCATNSQTKIKHQCLKYINKKMKTPNAK